MKKEDLEYYLTYLKSDEHKQATKQGMMNQIVGYLNHCYPKSSITMDGGNTFEIQGEDTGDILEFLKGMGLIRG